ncbi:Glucose dehydrogenase [FAD, quinone] [Frankliniella fusca]|uniref:Glucose dehydrogenase [FAD, quinone] n=1 Tax=Frankliniella fusca TaxID=407009 RepID=A0AAE1HGX0_9NEOP|nr:Glucose dehydrogenase [FAD, quinone] [Frankliniella fusca]
MQQTTPVPTPAPADTCPAVTMFTLFFVSLSARGDRDDLQRPPPALRATEFDFIVVGGGSAGCVLASRLSEVAHWRVLLLEAGRAEPEETRAPATYRNLQLTDMNWHYRSEPEQSHCNNTGCPCPKGKVLGGSSAINGFVYIRGSPQDYDDWGDALQDDTWRWTSVLPFFLRSENVLVDDLAQDTTFHSRGGELPVERLPNVDPVNKVLYNAMLDIGLPERDPNAGIQVGVSLAQTTTLNGERASANRAFLAPVRHRPNLVVRTRAHVTRVLLRHGQACGVEYRDGYSGQLRRAYANKEVVLSAGVMNTPQILMLSGIGPKQHLSSLGIKVVQDLPAVGENLMNHVTSLGIEYLLPDGWPPLPADINARVQDFTHFVPGGPLSSLGPEEVNAFVGWRGPAVDDRPVFNLRFYGDIPKSHGAPECVPAPPQDPLYYDRILVTPVVLACRSVGSVRLRSADPLAAPRIRLNLLGDREGHDLTALVAALQLAASLEDTPAFRAANLTLNRAPLAGCGREAFGSVPYWRCVARVHTLNTFHAAGTARMGPAAAGPGHGQGGALDPRMRVRGVPRLRVADASVFPSLPRGNTNAPVIMVGERAAHFIRQTWGQAV